MRFFWAIVLAALTWATPPSVSGPASQTGNQARDPEGLREANRVLEEEIKLAAHPQIYLLLNLPDRSIVIKGRGIELRRLPIRAWQAMEERAMVGVLSPACETTGGPSEGGPSRRSCPRPYRAQGHASSLRTPLRSYAHCDSRSTVSGAAMALGLTPCEGLLDKDCILDPFHRRTR